MDNSTIDKLLDKYWAAETSATEEQTLHSYFAGDVDSKYSAYAPLFQSYTDMDEIKAPEGLFKVPEQFQEQTPKATKIISLRAKIYRYAAVMVLGLCALFIVQQQMNKTTPKAMATNVEEVQDPELALEYTKQAFAMLAKNYKKGEKQLTENIGSVKEIQIFK